MSCSVAVDQNIKVDVDSSPPEEPKVMLVDDNESTLKLVKKNLQKLRDYKFVEVSDPEEALEKLDESFNCIVSDYKMPKMNGLEFLNSVKERFDMPFVLYTGKGSEEIASKAIRAGVDNYMKKKSGRGHYEMLAKEIDNNIVKHETEKALERARNRYKELVEASPIPIFVNRGEEVVYANQAALDMLDYDSKEEEVIGENAIDYVAPQDRDKLRRRIKAIMKGKEFDGGTYKFIDEDGEESIVEIKGSLINYEGAPAIQTSMRDVTEERKAKKELEEKKVQMEGILKSLPVGVVATNGEESISFINHKFVDLFNLNQEVNELSNLDREELVKKLLDKAQNPDQLRNKIEEMSKSDKDTLKNKTILKDGTKLRGKLKKVRTENEEWNIWAIREESGGLKIRDERLEEVVEVVSHELKNPLNNAKGYLDLVESEENSEEIKEAKEALNKMDEVIEHLIYVGKDENDLKTKRVDVEDVFKGSLDYFDVERVEYNVRGDLTLEADPSAVKALFENLVKNTLEHNNGKVTIEVGELENGFYYQDDGSGVSEQVREKIFDRGFSTEDEKTGFGLSAVKKIANTHGWEVGSERGALGGLQIEFYTE